MRRAAILEAIEEAVFAWEEFADRMYQAREADGRSGGSVEVVGGDIATLGLGEQTFDNVILSPPYANRLDYTRMWGPEISIAEAFLGISLAELQSRQLGSNVVHGRRLPQERLPRNVESTLTNIGRDSAPYSESYYEPFFRNYALQLQSALRRIGGLVARGGTLVVFVRDTVRRDFVLPTGALVRAVVCENGRFKLTKKAEILVRSHIGLRQQRYRSAIHGIAQHEHYLAFRRVA